MSADEGESWHWADADGVVSIVDEWELLSSLSTGSLPHYTLVWREGWKDWLPACQVADLANIVPKDKVEKAVDPGSDPLLTDPPPPPVDRYQAYQTREAAAKLLGKGAKPAARVPVAPPGLASAAPPPPPPPPAPRPAQPTLVEGAPMTSTATLRPPGAVPPPPRGVPAPSPIIAHELVAPLIQEKAPDEAAPVSAEVPTNPRPSAELAASAPLPSWSDDLDAEMRAGARPGRMKQTSYAPPPPVPAPSLQIHAPPRKSALPWVAALALFGFGALALVVAAAFYLRSSRQAGAPSATTATGAPTAASGRILPCKLEKKAARLAPSVLPAVVPVIASAGEKFAVGFAASEKEAEGIAVDATSLSVDRPFRQKADREISSVVPLGGGDLGFVVDQDDRTFRAARTLDPKSQLAVGWTEQGLARRTGDGQPTTLWPTATDKVTDPRVASLPRGGYAVTARRGGMGGSVLVGLLDASGDKQGELVEVASKPQVGTPAVAANDRGILVAFAARPTDDSYWTLQVGTAGPGATPKAAQGFATPPGGLGADAISPAVDGLSNGRWLLQWTEGAAGRRQVRIQTLGSDLVPVGDPVSLSPEESNAGQGVVMVRGDKALSLFMVVKGKTHELWGATLTCP